MDIGCTRLQLVCLCYVVCQNERCQIIKRRVAVGKFEQTGVVLCLVHKTYNLQLHELLFQNHVVAEEFGIGILQLNEFLLIYL